MKDETTMTIKIVPSDIPNRYHVTIPHAGTPDFTIVAKSAETAGRPLEEYIYNVLDCREDLVSWEDFDETANGR